MTFFVQIFFDQLCFDIFFPITFLQRIFDFFPLIFFDNMFFLLFLSMAFYDHVMCLLL